MKNFVLGRYAVVDIFYRHIWLNVDQESIAHDLRQAFRSHAPCMVVDLECYENYCPGLIDHTVCLDWSIPPVPLLDRTLAQSVKNSVYSQTIDYFSGQLINKNFNTVLTREQMLMLQENMMLFRQLRLTLDYRSGGLQKHKHSQEVLDKINAVFLTEFDNKKVKSKLYDFANQEFDQRFYVGTAILSALDALYE
jgi:hypothetical protein